MFRRFSVNFAILSMALDASMSMLALLLAAMLRPLLSSLEFVRSMNVVRLPAFLYLVVPLLWISVFLIMSVYDPKRIYKATDEFQNVAIATGLAALVLAGLLYFAHRDFSRTLFVTFVLFNAVLLLGWRIAARLGWRIDSSMPASYRVLIVGAGDVGRQVAQMAREYAWTGLDLIGYLDDDPGKAKNGLPILGTLGDARQVIQAHNIDEVVIALPRRANEQLNQLVMTLHDLPVHARIVPDYFALALHQAAVDDFAGIPMIDLRAPALNDFERLVKRLFDLIVSGAIAILALPMMGIVALAIKLDSPGPVLFRQKRVGENGRLFTMFKFRSMVYGAEKLQEQVNEVNGKGQVVHKKQDDPRVTRVGRFIRKFSLDELPQFFNVLRGDMSLVGPRPELPWLVEDYEPWQRKRFAVPQGITGWWQVNGRSDKPMHLHTEEDLFYVQNYSLWLDVYILLKTPFVALRGKGAY